MPTQLNAVSEWDRVHAAVQTSDGETVSVLMERIRAEDAGTTRVPLAHERLVDYSEKHSPGTVLTVQYINVS